jgi:hypothetical protein
MTARFWQNPRDTRGHNLRLRAIALALRHLRLRAVALALRRLRLRAIALRQPAYNLRQIGGQDDVMENAVAALSMSTIIGCPLVMDETYLRTLDCQCGMWRRGPKL